MGDDPAYLPVGTAVSAKYKGAFCEAKVSKVVRVVKCKITYKQGLGTATVTDEHVRGPLRVGHTVQARHADKKEFVEATITKIQDCSQYTVVFDDGDITTLRRTALCLKSGRHFNESETLDQLPLTHPEHWGFPVGGGGRGRGRRSRQGTGGGEDASGGGDDCGSGGGSPPHSSQQPAAADLLAELYSSDIGKVVCVEAGEKKKQGRENWFPGLVVVPSAQPTVRINVRDEFLVRSFRDGRYYTVPRKEILEFSRDMGSQTSGQMGAGLAEAMERALRYLDRDELPAHWERGPLFDLSLGGDSDSDGAGSDTSDDEPREEKDHFVAQLYKFMDDRGTPLNKNPTIANKDIDLYRLFRVVHKLGGYNRVTNQNKWRSVAIRLGYAHNHATYNSVKQAYKRFLLNFEDFYRKLGCTMINHPRSAKKNRGGRSLIRDRDRATPAGSPRPQAGSGVEQQQQVASPSSSGGGGAGPAPPDPPDTSCSSSDADTTAIAAATAVVAAAATAAVAATASSSSATTPRSKKQGTRAKTARATASGSGGEKVRALVDKFEEHAARLVVPPPEEEERVVPAPPPPPPPPPVVVAPPPPPPQQHTRSKSVGRTASGRQTPAPVLQEEKPVVTQPPKQPPQQQQRGRKRKEGEQTEAGASVTSAPVRPPTTPAPPVADDAPPLITASVGDKLKVYYGNGPASSHESKVTYEAKVLEVERDMYLVHYTGWNTRYDEWIKPQRIAENLSQQNKAAKQQQKLKASAAGSQASPKRAATGGGKRGRGGGSGGGIQRSATPQQQGPGSVRSPVRRPPHPQPPNSSRRTRRTSAVSSAAGTSDTDDEQTIAAVVAADESRTASDSEPEVVTKTTTLRRRARRRDEDDDDSIDKDEDEKPLKRTKRPTSAGAATKKPTTAAAAVQATQQPPSTAASDSEDDSESPKGRDFDLNQIRSELKGFEKAVKVSAPNDEPPVVTDAGTDAEASISSSPPLLTVQTSPPTEEKARQTGDDIYEFKEPEPFEFETSTRKLTSTTLTITAGDDKQKKRPQRPMYEGSPPTASNDSPTAVTVGRPTSPRKSRTAVQPAAASSPSTSERSPSPPPVTRRRTPNTYRRATPAAKKQQQSPETPPRKTQILSACTTDEDPFDKLAESPSFNVADKSGGGVLDMESLPLFRELPEVAGTGEDSGGSDLGPEPPPFARKEQPATALDPIFKGFSAAAAAAVAATAATSGGALRSAAASDDDDPIGAAIHRAMTHTLTDEDSSGDELFVGRKSDTTIAPAAPPPVDKLISPALQETDSRLLEAISEQTAQLLKKEATKTDLPVLSPPLSTTTAASTTKIADSILHKFNMIKKKEEVKCEPVEVEVEEEKKKKTPPREVEVKIEPIVEVKVKEEVKIKEEPKIKEETKVKEEPKSEVVEPSNTRRRVGARKVAVSREFIESDSDSSCSSGDDTSSTDSEPSRLVIAQPAEDDDEEEEEEDDEEEEEVIVPLRPETPPIVKSPPTTVIQETELIPSTVEEEVDEEHSSDMSLLLCKETIPGSPAAPDTPTQQQAGAAVRTKPRSAKSLLLEMPFASAPAVTRAQPTQGKPSQPPPPSPAADHQLQPLAVPLDSVRSPPTSPPIHQRTITTERNDDGATATSNPTTAVTTDAAKKLREQQETVAAGHVGRKRRRSQRASDEPQQPAIPQPPPAKRGRGRPLGSAAAATVAPATPGSGDEEPAEQIVPQPTPRRHPRYNFLIELDPTLDAAQRIALLTQRLGDLRRTYNEVKSELACIDRRRKKLRRRERDQLRQHKMHDVQAAA